MASRLGLAALLCLTLAAATAHADADADVREQARGLMDLGRQRAAEGDHAAALEAYRGAHELVAAPTSGLSVGEALIELGRLIEARDTLLQVARSKPEEKEPEPFSVARERAAALAQELAVRIPSLRVDVLDGAGEPVVATVKVDGKALTAAQLRLPRRLDPGEHEVTAEAEGHKPASRRVKLGDSEHYIVSLVLPELAVPAQRDEPRLELHPLLWIGGGVALAATLVGAATGAAALATADGLDEDCPGGQCSPAEEGRVDRMTALAHASTVSFSLAGVGIGVGVLGWFLGKESQTPSRGDAGATLWWATRF